MAMCSVLSLFIVDILSLIRSGIFSMLSFELWTRAGKSEGILLSHEYFAAPF